LEVYLDGRLIHTARLYADTLARVAPGGEDDPPQDPSGPDRPRRRSVVELPRDGRLRLAVELRRRPAGDGLPPLDPLQRPLTVTYHYDATRRLTSIAAGAVTTYTYELPADPEQQGADEPPDEPHVAD
jgi:hypothetical protein